jgi:RNA polymerase sigma-70 factor, ECF subfamily
MAEKDEGGKRRRSTDDTDALLRGVRDGDQAAMEQLAARHVESLHRLARARMSPAVRDRYESEELAWEAIRRGLERAATFDSRHRGAFLAYLRSILLNLIRDEARRVARRPPRTEIPAMLRDPDPTPLALTIDRQVREKYEAALARLPQKQRAAVFLRVEGYSYEEVARATGTASPDAARMAVKRGLSTLAKLMSEVRAKT